MIGILPCAGDAKRMHGLPKFLLPVLDVVLIKRHVKLMKPLVDIVFAPIKPDNYEYFDPYFNDIGCSSVDAKHHETMSESVLSVLEWVEDLQEIETSTLFGMPDTYIEDDHAYAKVADTLRLGAQVAMGVFFTRPEQRHKLGMCEVYGTQVTRIVDKPQDTDLVLAWGVLAWQPIFWQYLQPEDPHVGYGVQRAIEAGVDVRAVALDGGYWDCGTPDEYFDLIAHLHTEKV